MDICINNYFANLDNSRYFLDGTRLLHTSKSGNPGEEELYWGGARYLM